MTYSEDFAIYASIQPPSGHASFDGHTTVSRFEVSVPQARVCGTACYRTHFARFQHKHKLITPHFKEI